MLQQTQVRTVIPYFERFVAALPNLFALAATPLDTVLALWSGLGYYTRARNLHRCAQLCVERHDGQLPRDVEALSALPGIGRSTAAAILAQAHGDCHAILDGNVRRVLARVHAVHGWTGATATQRVLWELAEAHTPAQRVADYTQAIMDLGALVCVRRSPHCEECPLAGACMARHEGLTTVLPEAKPRRATPLRETAMLVVRDDRGRILLERRPQVGVWAGLWSLPETPGPDSALAALRDRHALDARVTAELDPFMHVFSHYRLRITPVMLRATACSARVADAPDVRWLMPDELAAVGLPAPVRTLLETLPEEMPHANSALRETRS